LADIHAAGKGRRHAPARKDAMVTTVGTEDRLEDLLTDLVQLDYDAVAAQDASFRSALQEFKSDHVRHIHDLGAILAAMGCEVPQEGDMKSLLTQGKVMIGGLMGDSAILQAMRTNEDDTNTAYQRAIQFPDAPPATHQVLERAREDERRHCAWILETLRRA
jgi:hypothetical protein